MEAQEQSNRQVFSVSEIARQVRDLLDGEFPALHVEGEISNFTRAASGHWYFTLKDDKAQLRCAMFRGRNQAVRFAPANGGQVVVRGKLGLYESRGEFQMVADSMEEAGDGALRRAFEKLKAALQAEGLFAEERKRPLPTLARHVAIVTSPAGAAIHDVLTVMGRRFPALRATLVPAQVQGDGAAPQLVRALELANGYAEDPFDLILLTRGGGSLEDLWAFNTEPVARAVAASRLPVVCAVGHESDVTIADLVADLRAATPSAAAELIAPDGAAWLAAFRTQVAQLVARMQRLLDACKREALHLWRRLRHPQRHLQDLQQRTDELRERLNAGAERQLQRQRSRLAGLRLIPPQQRLAAWRAQVGALGDKLRSAEASLRTGKAARLKLAGEKLHALSPLATLERGFAIVTDSEGQVLTQAKSVRAGDQVRARLQSGAIEATVNRVEES